MPCAAAREASHGLNTKSGSGTRGVFDLIGGTLADAFRLAITPNVRRKNVLVPLVDRITHRLTDEVIADRPALQPVFFQDGMTRPHIGVVRKCLAYVEVVAPAGQLHA